MQPAKHAFPGRKGMIVLHEGRLHAVSRENVGTKGFGKETTSIAMPGRCHQQNVWDLKPFNLHDRFLIERRYARYDTK
jgi:hypothetical protein